MNARKCYEPMKLPIQLGCAKFLTPFFTACNLMRGCNYYFVSVPTRKCLSVGFKNFFSWAFGSGLAATRTYQWPPRIFCLLVPSEFCTRRHSSPVVWHSKCWAGSSSLCRGQSRSILLSTRFYHFCLLKNFHRDRGKQGPPVNCSLLEILWKKFRVERKGG